VRGRRTAATGLSEWSMTSSPLPGTSPRAALIIYCVLPFSRRLNVTTAYEYWGKSYNLGIRLLGRLSFLLIELARMGVILYLPQPSEVSHSSLVSMPSCRILR